MSHLHSPHAHVDTLSPHTLNNSHSQQTKQDFALGIRMKEERWQCRYVAEHLVVGEAPEAVRNCFQQR